MAESTLTAIMGRMAGIHRPGGHLGAGAELAATPDAGAADAGTCAAGAAGGGAGDDANQVDAVDAATDWVCWFGGKARQIQSVEIPDIVPITTVNSYLIFARIDYSSGPVETYAIPLVRISSEGEGSALRIDADNVSEGVILKDAVTDRQFLSHLLDAIANRASWPGIRGQIRAVPTSALQSLWRPAEGPLTPSLMNAEQSNSSVVYDKRLVLKIFRRVEPGLNPDLEIGAFLTEKSSFRNVPPLAGYIEYRG